MNNFCSLRPDVNITIFISIGYIIYTVNKVINILYSTNCESERSFPNFYS